MPMPDSLLQQEREKGHGVEGLGTRLTDGLVVGLWPRTASMVSKNFQLLLVSPVLLCLSSIINFQLFHLGSALLSCLIIAFFAALQPIYHKHVLPRIVSETTGNEISARPYTVPYPYTLPVGRTMHSTRNRSVQNGSIWFWNGSYLDSYVGRTNRCSSADCPPLLQMPPTALPTSSLNTGGQVTLEHNHQLLFIHNFPQSVSKTKSIFSGSNYKPLAKPVQQFYVSLVA